MTPPTAGMTARRRIPPAGVALGVAAAALVFAALAIIAGRVGPLVARPRTVTATPPNAITGAAVPADTFPEPPPPPPGEWGATWLAWIGGALFALVVAALLWWLIGRLRARPPRPAAVPAPAAAPASIDAMLGGLSQPADVDLGDSRTFAPARAADDIIASWETVEAAAAAHGVPRRAAATPTEFLADVVAAAGDAAVSHGPPASAVLLGLYHRARFDVVALTPGAATLARTAAAGLVERLARATGDRVEPSTPGGQS